MSDTQVESIGKTPEEVVSEFIATYSVQWFEGLLMEVFKRYSLSGPEGQKGINRSDEKVAILFDDLLFLVEALHRSASTLDTGD